MVDDRDSIRDQNVLKYIMNMISFLIILKILLILLLFVLICEYYIVCYMDLVILVLFII